MTDLSTARATEPTPPWALAAASYLARYSGNTLTSYSISLRLGPWSRFRRAANAA
ncbi:MAG: hypothetical protein HIU86_12460 [Acidobacteria bacterium]|nr:hypothetical protein [Acidobacteriota bacterium]